ncbi:hypothetical protein ACN6A1_04325 [Myxococcus virescens]|uniref:hypothetical protein n=1 Tax=Myxococcus virescens TaxID=83456 RepID=UPI003DA1E9D1
MEDASPPRAASAGGEAEVCQEVTCFVNSSISFLTWAFVTATRTPPRPAACTDAFTQDGEK